jgi:PDZ domain-containing protein
MLSFRAKPKRAMHHNRLPRLATATLTLFFGLALFAPLPFVVLTPGNAQDVVNKIITPSKRTTAPVKFYKADGHIYLLSILITNPDAYVTGAELIYSWGRSDFSVMPRSLFYRDGVNAKTERAAAKTQMVDSQLSAKVAALNFLQSNYPTLNTGAIKPSDISISLTKTGGPSGGLAFALGIVELLTPENILLGRSVASTGTIDSEGNVGGIGGVAEKILAAEKAGATLILVPASNCKDLAPGVATIPKGIKVAAVSTLKEALTALNSATPRSCANLGA